MSIRSRSLGNLVLALVLLGTTLTPASDMAFTHLQKGETLPPMRLVNLHGGMESYLGPEADQISVFAFVKTNHPRSENLITQWASLQLAFAEQPVHWTLILSGRDTEGPTAPWDSLAPGATILIDSGDQLYGELGVVLTPTVGIADQTGQLKAYLPFRQINYSNTITAHVRRLLGSLSEQEFQKALNPSGRAHDSLEAGAKRKLKLGRILLKRGKLVKALTQTEKALAECPELAAGYLLLAEIHLAAGREKEAAAAAALAQQLADQQSESETTSEGD